MKFTLTDRLMWHFMQGTCYKVLRAEYPEWDFHQLRKAAKERFGDILTSTPSIGSYRENSLKKNLVGGMVWFAIYETAKERYGSQMSLPLYEKMCRASIAMPMMLRMARMTKLFTRKFQESMMKRSERENRIDSPYSAVGIFVVLLQCDLLSAVVLTTAIAGFVGIRFAAKVNTHN